MYSLKHTANIALAIFTLIFLMSAAQCQTGKSSALIGVWEGSICFTNKQPKIQLMLEPDSTTGLKGTLNLLEQGNQNLPLHNVQSRGDTIRFEVTNGRATVMFFGLYSEDGRGIVGDFRQAGYTFPFQLEKVHSRAPTNYAPTER